MKFYRRVNNLGWLKSNAGLLEVNESCVQCRDRCRPTVAKTRASTATSDSTMTPVSPDRCQPEPDRVSFLFTTIYDMCRTYCYSLFSKQQFIVR